jgi:hypothetical protein
VSDTSQTNRSLDCGYYISYLRTSLLSSLFDNPAASFWRPVALRLRLATGLPLSQCSLKKSRLRYFD